MFFPLCLLPAVPAVGNLDSRHLSDNTNVLSSLFFTLGTFNCCLTIRVTAIEQFHRSSRRISHVSMSIFDSVKEEPASRQLHLKYYTQFDFIRSTLLDMYFNQTHLIKILSYYCKLQCGTSLLKRLLIRDSAALNTSKYLELSQNQKTLHNRSSWNNLSR